MQLALPPACCDFSEVLLNLLRCKCDGRAIYVLQVTLTILKP